MANFLDTLKEYAAPIVGAGAGFLVGGPPGAIAFSKSWWTEGQKGGQGVGR